MQVVQVWGGGAEGWHDKESYLSLCHRLCILTDKLALNSLIHSRSLSLFSPLRKISVKCLQTAVQTPKHDSSFSRSPRRLKPSQSYAFSSGPECSLPTLLPKHSGACLVDSCCSSPAGINTPWTMRVYFPS